MARLFIVTQRARLQERRLEHDEVSIFSATKHF